jgi:hypothetical protein
MEEKVKIQEAVSRRPPLLYFLRRQGPGHSGFEDGQRHKGVRKGSFVLNGIGKEQYRVT